MAKSMKAGERYVARRDLHARDITHACGATIIKGSSYIGLSFMELADGTRTLHLPRHVARNPSWYFSIGIMPQDFVPPSLEDYCFQLVSANEGLKVAELYELAVDGCPLEKTPTYSSFTAALSANERVEMRDVETGVPVTGRGHNTRGNTYHVKALRKYCGDKRV